MLSSRCCPLCLVPVLLFVFIQSSSTFPAKADFPDFSVSGKRANDAVVSIGRRYVAEEGNASLILAADRTHRRDPLDSFQHYNGGYNISNEHYWASVGFTASIFFIIAGLWFLLFGLCLGFVCCCYCCCPREPYGYSRTCYAMSLIFLVFFTLVAILGCVFLYAGQARFHNSVVNTLEYVVSQADATVRNLRNISEYLAAAKNIGVDSVSLPANMKSSIDNVKGKLNSSSSALLSRTRKNSEDIQVALRSTRMALVVVSAIMLALVFFGFLFSILGMQSLVYILVILGWILVAGTFILCGVFLLLHNVAADTCVAMGEWVQNPTAKTAMDDIIPCVDKVTAEETMARSKEVTYQLILVVDDIIGTICNINYTPQAGQLYYNQSGPLMPALCNPFYSDLTHRQCADGEVDLDDATQAWKNFTCQVSAAGICATPGRATPDMHNQLASAANLSYGLYHYGPYLMELEDCTFVRRTFTEVSHLYCPHLLSYTRWIYTGLLLVSASVMLSLLFWMIYARERKHRLYTKQFSPRRPISLADKAP